ncbi:MAG: glutamyl-tRNA amidotransferase [Eubacteriales bacterium]|nr:glutamyl-tRNA amidotransferase [Eubacteriales bacterium]
MVIVDVYVPVVNKNYDFSVNEKSKISFVIEEISEIIAQKEGCSTIKNPESFILCNAANNSILDPEKTLEAYGLGNGIRLMLV